ncbi:unnamed protein product [Protopolystoma xenopodis]|uniref:Uncharacterized protein n=1 Tax=Protopolystoma xenopodis TaxID=117903 RepID=A0A448WDI4_9PLAT|nr:unnamed protein product [Protopolystoma xenopodis]
MFWVIFSSILVSGSEDFRTITDQSSTQIHRGRRAVSRGFLRTVQQTKIQGNPPAVSGEAAGSTPTQRKLAALGLFIVSGCQPISNKLPRLCDSRLPFSAILLFS